MSKQIAGRCRRKEENQKIVPTVLAVDTKIGAHVKNSNRTMESSDKRTCMALQANDPFDLRLDLFDLAKYMQLVTRELSYNAMD